MRSVRDGEQHPNVIVMQGVDDVAALPLANDEPKMTQHTSQSNILPLSSA
jgi:hypothetical protein